MITVRPAPGPRFVENEESPGRVLRPKPLRPPGLSVDTSTIGRSLGVSLRLDLNTSPVSPLPRELRGGRSRFSEPLPGLPACGPVVTVCVDPVARATDVVPIGEPSSSSPVGWRRFLRSSSGSTCPHGHPWLCVAPAVLCPVCRFRCASPLPVRRALFGTNTTFLLTKHLVKGYFPSHRVLHRTSLVVPRLIGFVHCPSTDTVPEPTG